MTTAREVGLLRLVAQRLFAPEHRARATPFTTFPDSVNRAVSRAYEELP